MKDKTVNRYAWLNLIFYILAIIINYSGASGLINGMDQRTVSDKYMTLITPAPMTFSVWGVIYSLLLITIIWLIIKQNDDSIAMLIRAISPLIWLNFALNALWIVAFSFEMIALSAALIFLILLTLTQIGIKLVRQVDFNRKILPALTFGIYAGWVTVATVVNIAAWLVKIEWDGFGLSADVWTTFTLVAALVVITYIVSELKNVMFTLVSAWAYYGILVAHQSAQLFNSQYPIIQYVLMGGIVYLLALSAWRFYQNQYNILDIR